MEPILIPIPIIDINIDINIKGIDPERVYHTLHHIQRIYKKVPIIVMLRAVILIIITAIIFYVFLIIIALTLFNLAIALIFVLLLCKHVKWTAKSSLKMKRSINMK